MNKLQKLTCKRFQLDGILGEREKREGSGRSVTT